MKKDDSGPLHKAVHALALVPRRNRIEVLGRKAYSAMLWHAQRQALGQPGLDRFSAPLNEIMKTLGGADSIKHVKVHLADMVSTVVEWNSPSGDSDIAAPDGQAGTEGGADGRKPAKDRMSWKVSGLLASAELHKVRGETWVSWEYSGALRRELIEPSRYAQIDMAVVAQLSTHTAVALYEICARYRTNPGGKTPQHPWEWWGPVLTGTPAEDRSNFEYKVFKRDYLKRAIAQINALDDIEIELIEHKRGRQIQDLQFLVRQKARAPRVPQAQPAPADLSLLQRASRSGVSGVELSALLERYPEGQLHRALDILEKRQTAPGAPALNDAGAYLRTVLANGLGSGATASSGDREPRPKAKHPAAPLTVQEPSAQPLSAPKPPVAPQRLGISLGEAVQRVREERLATARQSLDDLSDEDLAQLAAQACAELQARIREASPALMKLLAPRIRRLQASDLRLPRTLNELAEQQVRRQFGEQWDQPDAQALKSAARLPASAV